MAHSPAVRRAVQDLVRHCHSGLDSPDLQHRLLQSVRRVVPADAAFFATADPETLLFTGGFAEDPLHTVTAQFVDNEFGAADVNRFADLATASTPVASLDAATGGDRFASARYREIMRPLGLGDELRVALVAGTQCWGYLCLHRTDHAGGFTDAEMALMASVAPQLADALRQSVLLRGAGSAEGAREPGVVVLSDGFEPIAVTDRAAEFLAELESPGGLPLPACVYAVAATLHAIEDGTAPQGALPTTRVRTCAGRWLRVHASRLQSAHGRHGITVVIDDADAGSTVGLRLSAHGLSPREVEVATLVLRGASTRTISATLHISEYTVQDHLKAVFDKVGVRSRRELVGTMLG